MGEMFGLSGFLRNIIPSRLRRESFIVLDIGTFSVKALLTAHSMDGEDIKVLGAVNRHHVGSDVNIDGTFNVDGIIGTSRAALAEINRRARRRGIKFSNNLILGIGGGFGLGRTLTQTYIREKPGEEIDESEFANIIQKVQQRNYDQLRRDFKKETGRSELEVQILNSAVLEIKIDGYEVLNPIGFKGKEISCSVFNGYIQKSHFNLYQRVIHALRLNLTQVIPLSYAAFVSLVSQNPAAKDFILIDIGGTTTEISLARKGKLEDIKSISVGGSSFTQSIAENLKIGFWEAENIKLKFAKGEVSRGVGRQIEAIILKDAELLLRGFEMVLADMSQTVLLPPNIYLYGGGSALPLLYKILEKKNWRNSLSFFAKPVISSLPAPPFAEGNKLFADPYWAGALAIYGANLAERKRNSALTKIVRRSLRLMQN